MDGFLEDKWKESNKEEEKLHYCPTCLRRLPFDVEICPFCNSLAVTELTEKTTPLLTIAGAAAMGVAVLYLIAALLSFPIAILSIGEGSPYSIAILPAIVILNIIGLILSETAASYCWQRKRPNFTVMAVAVLPLIGFMNIMAANLPFRLAAGFGLALAVFGIPIVALSLFSLSLIIVEQEQFKRGPRKPRRSGKPSERRGTEMVRLVELSFALISLIC